MLYSTIQNTASNAAYSYINAVFYVVTYIITACKSHAKCSHALFGPAGVGVGGLVVGGGIEEVGREASRVGSAGLDGNGASTIEVLYFTI